MKTSTTLDVLQGSEEWDKARALISTASEYDKIFTGGGKKSSQAEAYMRKLSIATKYSVPSFQGNQYTDRGHELEPVARERFAEASGFDVREAGFEVKAGGRTGCSPDGLIYNGAGEAVAGLEIKCFGVDKHLTITNKGVCPTAQKAQVHGSLSVTGLDAWVLVYYCPEAFPLDLTIFEVTPDRYTQQLDNAVESFCDDHQANWQQYLAEYEVDMLDQKIERQAPVTLGLVGRVHEYETTII